MWPVWRRAWLRRWSCWLRQRGCIQGSERSATCRPALQHASKHLQDNFVGQRIDRRIQSWSQNVVVHSIDHLVEFGAHAR
jgi:hypothetical protein